MDGYFSFTYLLKTFPTLLSYAHISVIIMLAAFSLGNLIGIAGAFARINRVPVLNHLTVIYVSFIRGTPLLVLLFLIYFGLPEALIALGYTGARQLPPLFYVIVGFALSVGGYILAYEYLIKSARDELGLKIKLAGAVILSDPTFFILRKSPETEELVTVIDTTLKELRADGTLAALSEKFFGADYTFPQQ